MKETSHTNGEESNADPTLLTKSCSGNGIPVFPHKEAERDHSREQKYDAQREKSKQCVASSLPALACQKKPVWDYSLL